MAVAIGSNISSLRTIRQLDGTTRNLASTSERLASGQRINRASDDAAGLAIASSLDTTSRVLTKALANVNDGISLLSITDGAMRELGTILTRVRELATQSANGSYSSVQRRALDEEGQKLRDEYNRILATTAFNGVKTLNGSQATIAIQAGTDGVSAALQLTAPNLGQVGTHSSANSLRLDGANDYVNIGTTGVASNDYSWSVWVKVSNAPAIGELDGIISFGSGDQALGLTNAYSGLTGFTMISYDSTGATRAQVGTLPNTDVWTHVVGVRNTSNSTLKVYINGSEAASTTLPDNTAIFGDLTNFHFIGARNGNNYFDGFIDDVQLYNRALGTSEIASLADGGSASPTGLVAHYDFEEGSGSVAADKSGNGNHGSLMNGATWATDHPSQLGTVITAALETFSLLTASDARSAMDTIESAFSRLSGEVGRLGSQLSRLQTVINTISSARENYQAAAGRIKDADVAQESANLVRHEILQQTASGVLAQANQQPRIAIQLLGAI